MHDSSVSFKKNIHFRYLGSYYNTFYHVRSYVSYAKQENFGIKPSNSTTRIKSLPCSILCVGYNSPAQSDNKYSHFPKCTNFEQYENKRIYLLFLVSLTLISSLAYFSSWFMSHHFLQWQKRAENTMWSMCY